MRKFVNSRVNTGKRRMTGFRDERRAPLLKRQKLGKRSSRKQQPAPQVAPSKPAAVSKPRAMQRPTNEQATKYDQRKDAIIRAAAETLNHNGVRGMTLALVAAELNLAPRAVSYYFRHKEDLAAACYKRSIERIDGFVTEALKADALADGIRTFVSLFFEGLRRIETGEDEPIAWFEELRTLNEPTSGAAFVAMFKNVRGLVALNGAPPCEQAERNARAHLLLSQMFWAVLWLPGYNPEDYGRMADRTADILINGIAARRGALRAPDLLISDSKTSGPDFLHAATELINAEGYRGASVNKIAAQLNVTKGSFYKRVETKDELVEKCFERTWTILRQAQSTADQQTQDALTNLLAQTLAMVGGQVTRERPLLRTSALAAVPESMRDRLLAGFERITARYASVVSDGFGDGSIRPLDGRVAAEMLSGAINAAAELHYWAPGLTPQSAEQWYISPLFRGFLAR